MKDTSSAFVWRPAYPVPMDEKVLLSDIELETCESDQSPAVSVVGVELDDPAFFWIDREHVYLRANWGQWYPVSQSSPGHIAALCGARCFRIAHTNDNVARELTAPVFHVRELPCEVFGSSDEKVSPKRTDASMKKDRAIRMLADRIPSDVDAMAFKYVNLGGVVVDLVVSSEDSAVIFAVYPDDEDYAALPCGEGETSLNQENHTISKALIDKLVDWLEHLHELEPEAELHAAIIASGNTLKSMRAVWKDKLDETGIALVNYSGFEDFQRAHLPSSDSDEDD